MLGALAGAALGILLANLLGRLLRVALGAEAGFGIRLPVVLASIALGRAPPLAALPAVRRAARLPLGEALRASGSAVGGQGRLDALLRRVRAPRSAQIGLRGLGRRKRRSLATVVQIGLAVATLLAMSRSAPAWPTTRGHFDDYHFDVWIQSVASEPFGAGAGALIRSTDGVGRRRPGCTTGSLDGHDVQAFGLPAGPLIDTRMTDGRWYRRRRGAPRRRSPCSAPAIARTTGARVGDRVRVSTANGPVTLRVIGITGFQAGNGEAVFMPLTTLQRALGAPGSSTATGSRTTRADHGLIDRATTRLEDGLGRPRHPGRLARHLRRERADRRRQLGTDHDDHGARPADRRDQHGRAGQRDHDGRARAHARDRHAAQRRRPRPRRPPHLRHRGPGIALAGWLLGVPLGYAFAHAIVGRPATPSTRLRVRVPRRLRWSLALAGTVLLACW